MSSGEEAPESLTGVWHGQYTYPMGLLPPAMFMATIIDSGGTLGGATQEDTHEGSKQAVVDGKRDGASVRFVKVYSPASEEFQDVIYTGALNGDRTEIEGEWMVPGVWQGQFLMIRARGKAQSTTRGVKKEINA